jgi:hypothetical protein
MHKKNTDHYIWLLTADIILIDEISMLTASALSGVDHALSFVMSNATSIVSPSGGPFGCKSVVTLGDLYQLPAIEGIRFEDQVYSSILWGYFRFVELTESCRTDATEVEFAALLSRARIGWAGVDNAVREADEALLKTRLCTEHCACNDDGVRLLEPFDDVERLKVAPPGGGKPTVVETLCRIAHCPLGEGAMVLAALRQKVNEVNESWSDAIVSERAASHAEAQALARDAAALALNVTMPPSADRSPFSLLLAASASAASLASRAKDLAAEYGTSTPAMVAAAATLESASIALDHAAWASVEGITVTGPLGPLTATGIAQGSAIHAACSSAAACASAVIEAASRRTFDALAIDRRKNGAELIDRRGQNALDSVRKQIDRATRGQLRRLKVYVGMRGVLTDNKNMKEDFINGTTGVVTAVHLDAHGNAPAVLYFRPDGGATDVRVTPKRTVVTIHGGVGDVERYQFPLLPAHCVTVHRVQGTTVERDLHLLLNREFFAYGQAYVALSRVRRLTQLHLWSLDMAAFSASPRIASEYEKLRMRPLTREYVESARPLRTLGVPPPVAAAALRGGAGKKRALGA